MMKPRHHFIADLSLRSAKSYTDFCFDENVTEIRDGAYPLHIALSQSAPLEVVSILVLKAPSVLNMKNKCGKIPLDVAIESQSSKDIINFLKKEMESMMI